MGGPAAQGRAVQLEVVWGEKLLAVRQVDAARAREAAAALADETGAPVDVDALDAGQAGSVQAGALTLRYRPVEAPPRAQGRSDVDFAFFKIATISLLVALAVVAMFRVTWLGGGGEGEGVFGDPALYRKILVKAEPPTVIKRQDRFKDADALADAKARPDDAPRPVDAPRQPVVDKRERDKARVAGVLGDLFGGSARSSVFSEPGLGAGVNDALGNMKPGNASVEAGGFGGMGSRGTSPGGPPGGLSLGSVGAFRGGRPPGGDLTFNPGGGGRHVSVTPCGSACREIISDGLPRDVVAKVISRHLSEIKFCYEQQLQHDQALAGKIAVAFTIDGTGAVGEAAVAESTLNNANVEACVLERIRRWRFPEPRGGGVVSVTYPWVFRPAGGED